jgi:hypothetical protein
MLHVVADLVLNAPPPPSGGNSLIPDGPAQLPPGLGPLAAKLIGWGKGIILSAGVIGIFICSGMLILGRRNRGQLAIEGMIGGAWVLGGLALASVAAVLVSAFAI